MGTYEGYGIDVVWFHMVSWPTSFNARDDMTLRTRVRDIEYRFDSDNAL